MSMSESEYTPPPPPQQQQSNGKANPAVLFIIVILAVVFFISGLLHLLARFITKHRSSSSSSSSLSDHNPDISNSETFQRQLQQLFNLHDSGLDQSFIDALPLFQYKEIKGLDEPFDCAVCLSRFLEDDKLRLLPLCSHAFHIDCIDTWLLSNSTCPLCRGSLYTPGLPIQNPVFESEDWSEEDCGSNIGLPNNVESNEVEIAGEKKMVLPVKLGKFKSSNRVKAEVETSSSNLDARRCFSMGSYQYVVAESELQVALSSSSNRGRVIDGDPKGKKINMKSKNDSFSVSKIWLWSSNKGKFPGSSPNITDVVDHAGVDMRFPWNNVD